MTEESSNQPPQTPHHPDGWELMCAGIMRTEFGRRKSRAVARAMLRLTAEAAARPATAVGTADWREKIPGWLTAWWRSQPVLVALGGAVAVLLLIFAAGLSILYLKPEWLVGRYPPAISVSSGPVCRLTDALDARWAARSPRLGIGDAIPGSPLQLESGVVELTFATTAKLAVEGPAQFRVVGPGEMELSRGKVATDVPRRAKGFTVKTPTATVTDLGTRFGAIVGSDQTSEVDVFQGRVQLTTAANGRSEWRLTQDQAMIVDRQGAETADALPETAFPQPNLRIEVRPQNCGFDVAERAAQGGMPENFGYWSGPAYLLVTGVNDGVPPYSGRGMLQFQAPATGNVSAVWQLMDLRSYKKLLAGGRVEATLSARFQLAQNAARRGDKFGLTLAAFHGVPADIQSLWARRATVALALANKEIPAADVTSGWHKVKVTAKLPAETDFLAIELRAEAPAAGQDQSAAFTGLFADVVDVELSAPLRASSIAVSR